MPIYSFESKGGDVIDELVPLGTTKLRVNGKNYTKKEVPDGFALTGIASGMPSQAEQVKDGYYKLEQTMGSKFLSKSEFSVKQIKKAWGF
jgi:hypothetical protein